MSDLVAVIRYVSKHPNDFYSGPLITPDMVLLLREKTGAGMGTCKRALYEANGDPTEAEELVRRGGLC